MRETERAGDILKRLRDHHNCFCVNYSDKYTSGLPDSLIIPHGKREIWVEFKGQRTPLEVIQRKTIQNMRDKGANVFVVRFIAPREWIVEDRTGQEYSIKFDKLSNGVNLLLDTLIELSSQKGEQLVVFPSVERLAT